MDKTTDFLLRRRQFLRRAAAWPALSAVASPFALNLAAIGSASAFGATDYKALVCIFLEGGNDSFNMVLATDNASWSQYNRARQSDDSLALMPPGTAPRSGAPGSPVALGGVLPISPLNNQGRTFALHPQLLNVRSMFGARRLAVVPNVGPLVRPMDKDDYHNVGFPRPPKLFSHNDQRATWQALSPEGARVGWGGRMGDLMAGVNRYASFTAVSAAGNAVLLSGNNVVQYGVGVEGPVRIGAGGTGMFSNTAAYNALLNVLGTARSNHVLDQDYTTLMSRSVELERAMSLQLPSATSEPYGTAGLADGQPDPKLQFSSPLARNKVTGRLAGQLQIVARIIGARDKLGMKRQVFFVNLRGFDTHDTQNSRHAALMAELDHAIGYFDGVLAALGVRDQVTTFTASDFGRTFTTNGDGTDHGWGAHQLVFGGAVRGGDIHGRFPTYGQASGDDDFSSPDQLHRGVLLPSYSVEQYAATFGQWLGLSTSEVLGALPNLGNWPSGQRNLGFMG